MFAIAFMVGLKPFIGTGGDTSKKAHEGPPLLWIGPLVLAVSGLCAAVLSATVDAFVSSPMASAIAGRAMEVHTSIVPHVSLPLMLSAVTIALGALGYRFQDQLREGVAKMLATIGWGPDRGFDQAIQSLLKLSFAVTRVVQNGRLDIYSDRDIHRRRSDLAGPYGHVRRIAVDAGISSPAVLRMDDHSYRDYRHRRGRLRQGSADRDRLAWHTGFCGGAAVHAVRRTRSVLHPVHGRDAFCRHPGAGDDTAQTVANPTTAPPGKKSSTLQSRRLAALLSGCSCSRSRNFPSTVPCRNSSKRMRWPSHMAATS